MKCRIFSFSLSNVRFLLSLFPLILCFLTLIRPTQVVAAGELNNLGNDSLCICNYDGDEYVNRKDVGFFLRDFGTLDCTQSGGCDSDFNGDTAIDGLDLFHIASEYGRNNCDLWRDGTIVYIVDDPPIGSPVHYRELGEAVTYLLANVPTGQIGKVVIQTNRELIIDELSFPFDFQIVVGDGYAGRISGPETSPLIINAAGAFHLAGLSVSSSGGVVVNASRRIELVANQLPDSVVVNFEGGTTAAFEFLSGEFPEGFLRKLASDDTPLASGSRIFDNDFGELQLNFNASTISGFYGVENNRGFGLRAGGSGSVGGSARLHFGGNEISNLGLNVDIQGMARVSATSHVSLNKFLVNSQIESGNPVLDFSGNITSTAEFIFGGLGSLTLRLHGEKHKEKTNLDFGVQGVKLHGKLGEYYDIAVVLGGTLLKLDWKDFSSTVLGPFFFNAYESDNANIFVSLSQFQFNGNFKASLNGEVTWWQENGCELRAFGHVEVHGNLKDYRAVKSDFEGGMLFEAKGVGVGITTKFENVGFRGGDLFIMGQYNFNVWLTITDAIFGGDDKQLGGDAGIYVYGPLSWMRPHADEEQEIHGSTNTIQSDQVPGQITISGLEMNNSRAWIEIVQVACPVTITNNNINARPLALHLERVIGPINIINNPNISGGGVNIFDSPGPLNVLNNSISCDIPHRSGALALSMIPTNPIINGNIIDSTETGVSISSSSTATIEENTITALRALDVNFSDGVFVSDNEITGQSVGVDLRWMTGSSVVQDNGKIDGGIIIQDCSGSVFIHNNTISYDKFGGPGGGILVTRTSSPSITGNVITSVGTGIGVYDTGSYTVASNQITGATALNVAGETRMMADSNEITGNVDVYARLGLLNNTFSNTTIQDWADGLLNDPMESNEGLDPERIWTHIDWDGNGCCDYPPFRNEKDEDGKCVCQGVEPSS